MAEIYKEYEVAKSNKVKTKGPEEPKKLWSIGVDTDKWTSDNEDGEDSDEPYSYRGTTSSTWDINGLYLLPREDHSYGYREIVDVGFEPVVGKTYHLLFCVYSTGDSFGHDDQACFEAIGVYENAGVAYENEKRLREGHPLVDGQYGSKQVLLLLEGTEKQHPYNRPWDGYFESLDRLEVESFVLMQKKEVR